MGSYKIPDLAILKHILEVGRKEAFDREREDWLKGYPISSSLSLDERNRDADLRGLRAVKHWDANIKALDNAESRYDVRSIFANVGGKRQNVGGQVGRDIQNLRDYGTLPPTRTYRLAEQIRGGSREDITVNEKDFDIRHETPKAALVSVEGQEPAWLPKSTFKKDGKGKVVLSDFAADKIHEASSSDKNNPFTDRMLNAKVETSTPKQSTSLMAKTLGKTGRMYSTGGAAGEWTAEMREAANARSADQHGEWTPELADAANARTKR